MTGCGICGKSMKIPDVVTWCCGRPRCYAHATSIFGHWYCAEAADCADRSRRCRRLLSDASVDGRSAWDLPPTNEPAFESEFESESEPSRRRLITFD